MQSDSLEAYLAMPAGMDERAKALKAIERQPLVCLLAAIDAKETTAQCLTDEYGAFVPARYVPIIQKPIDAYDPLVEKLAAFLLPSHNVPFAALVGPSGAGKTTLALAVALAHVRLAIGRWRVRVAEDLEALDNGVKRNTRQGPQTPVFMQAQDISTCRRFSPLGQEPKALYKAKHAGLLILDDVVGTKDQDNDLYGVIWHREAENMPTIITSTMSAKEMDATYGATFSRRVFSGTSHVVDRSK